MSESATPPPALLLSIKDGQIGIQLNLRALPVIGDPFTATWTAVRVVDDDLELAFGQQIGGARVSVRSAIVIRIPAQNVDAALQDAAFESVLVGNLGGREVSVPDVLLESSLLPNAEVEVYRAQMIAIDQLGHETAIRFFRLGPVETRTTLAQAAPAEGQMIDASEAAIRPIVEIALSSLDFARLWRQMAKMWPTMKDPFHG